MKEERPPVELSVIVPTYNRSAVLIRCLEALAEQGLSLDKYEVIVSDDGSTEPVGDLVEEISKRKSPLKISYLRQINTGANKARNAGIKKAKGNILLFINDDTIATPHMVMEHLRSHRLNGDNNVAVLGRVTASPESALSPFAKLHLDAAFGRLAGKRYLGWEAFYTCNVSVKKSFLDRHGLFEESLRYHEDIELAERLSHHGLTILYNPKALGYHDHYLKEDEYLRIARLDGEALVRWYKKAPHLKDKLAAQGLFIGQPFIKRIKYHLADVVVNRRTRPFLLYWARRVSADREALRLSLYRKLFQSIKREAVRSELHK